MPWLPDSRWYVASLLTFLDAVFTQFVSGELWVIISQFSGLEHWENVACNVIITPPAPGSEDAVEVLDPETGVTRYLQPHIKEYVTSGEEDVVEVRVDLRGTQ